MTNHRPPSTSSGRSTDSQIISHALALLATGILASALPNRLMDEFEISAAKARELAGKAMEQHKAES